MRSRPQAAELRIRAILDPCVEPLLVEVFVPGARWHSRACSSEGDWTCWQVFDKPDAMDGPFFEETIYVTPAPTPIGLATRKPRCRAATALGWPRARCTPSCGSAGPPRSRCSSSPLAPSWPVRRALVFGTGTTLEEIIIAHALGIGLGALRREDSGVGRHDAADPVGRDSGRGGGARARPRYRRVDGVEISIHPDARWCPFRGRPLSRLRLCPWRLAPRRRGHLRRAEACLEVTVS